jgi:hypothetical protein
MLGRLRELAGDSSYAAGRDYLRKGLVKHGSVAGTTAYATVSGSTDYRISIAFGAAGAVDAGEVAEVKVTCTCPAHRRNKYCKHVVAVGVALVERPGEFLIGQAPPEVQQPARARGAKGTRSPGAPRAARPRAPKQQPEELRAAGLETVDRLLEDLADGGLAGLGPDKVALLESAAELVRALKLRRLGNLLMALRHATERDRQSLEAGGFATLLADLWATRRATGAHLAGAAQMDAQAAEELIGKTWRDDELEPVSGLDLLEVAFTRRSDGEFTVETSYLADLGTGQLYLERQITPDRLRCQPKTRHRLRLQVEQAALYPGPRPRRVKLQRYRRAPLAAADVGQWLERVPVSLAALRLALLERAAQPFGAREVPVALRPAALVEREGQRMALDAGGHALALRCAPRWMEGLAPLLIDGPSDVALFGLLSLDGVPPGNGGGSEGRGGQAGRGGQSLTLECLSAVSPSLAWSGGAVYPPD